MKKIILVFCVFSLSFFSFAQENKLPDFTSYKNTNLGIGYHLSFKDTESPKSYHLLSLDLNKSNYNTGRHVGGFQYGFGTEIALNTEDLVIGAKVSGLLYLSIFCFGAELITYTNFNDSSLRLSPVLGLGVPSLRITISPHLILTNKSFQPINKGYVSLVYNLQLRSKKRRLIKNTYSLTTLFATRVLKLKTKPLRLILKHRYHLKL